MKICMTFFVFLFLLGHPLVYGADKSQKHLEKRLEGVEKELEKNKENEKALEKQLRDLQRKVGEMPIPPPRSTPYDDKRYPWIKRKSLIKVFDRDFGNHLPLPPAPLATRNFHSGPQKDFYVFLPPRAPKDPSSSTLGYYLFDGLEFQGFVDVRFVFDEDILFDGVESFDFQLGEVEIDIIKRFPRIAFLRADIDFTSSGAVVEQAYGGAFVPWWNTIEFRFGRFNSPMGTQGPDAPTKDLISPSMVQGLGLPENFLGAWFSHPFFPWMNTYFIVANGWDINSDNNDGKTFTGRMELAAKKDLVIGVSGGGGPEQPGSDSNWRYYTVFDAIYTPATWLKFTFDFTWGYEENATVGFLTGGTPVINDADWFGVQMAGVARIYRWLDFALRYEYFDDDNGARVVDNSLFRSLVQVAPNNAIKVHSVSGQVNFHFVEGADIRVEWQYNNGNGNVFKGLDGGLNAVENVITFQGLFVF